MKHWLTMILVLLITLTAGIAQAEEWVCKYDSAVNNSNYCGICGKPRQEAMVTLTPVPRPIQKGDYVCYGAYPQQAGSSVKSPIEWYVLDVKGNRIQLISRYILDCMPYQDFETYDEDIASGHYWESCTLRSWLQNDFVTTAFSQDEARYILPTHVRNNDAPDTIETVYLLSTTEAEDQLGCLNYYQNSHKYESFESLINTIPANQFLKLGTPYMVSVFRARVGNMEDWEYMWESAWWARDIRQVEIPYVFDAFVYDYDWSNLPYGVRPVMWVDSSAPLVRK